MKYCANCGKMIDDSALFCKYCGSAQSGNKSYYKKSSFFQRVLKLFEDDEGLMWCALGAVCPPLGVIIYLLYRKDRPIVANRALICAVICTVSFFVVLICARLLVG